jgi:LysM repeat protein
MNPMKRLLLMLMLLTSLLAADFSTARGDSLPDSAYVSGFIGHPQSYAISCESRSAVDLAAFWGVSIGETEFLHTMPSSDDPEVGFVGNPNDPWGRIPPLGYGVHAGPVAKTLRDFGLKAEAYKDLSWDNLREEIRAGRPVIVWVIGGMWAGTPVDYKAEDGSTTRVAAFEHTMILTGYSSSSVQVVDAYTGQYQYYLESAFLKSWAVLGNMAVFSEGVDHQQSNLPQVHGDTYTVQRGDYVIALARQFGIDWRELVDLNSLPYPYTIYPGQVLQLPAAAGEEAVLEPEPAATPKPVWDVKVRVSLPFVGKNASTKATVTVNSTAQDLTKTMRVLHADTLINFAHTINEDWRVLVELNQLRYPYVVYPGQVLRVRSK